jgi:hypothetical protein
MPGFTHTHADQIQMVLDLHVVAFGEEQDKWVSDWDTLSYLTTTINKIRDKLRIHKDAALGDFFDGPVDREHIDYLYIYVIIILLLVFYFLFEHFG